MTDSLPAAPDLRTPWPGLDAFTKEDQDRFRGRQTDVEELYRRVTGRIGTVLYGQSGLGKTSLLQAGLIPFLEKEHYLPVNIHLIHGNDAPPLMDQVKSAVTRVLSQGGLFEPVYPQQEEDFWRYLHRRDVPFITQEGHDAQLVLIFDQFEEIFTNGQSTPEQARASKEFFAQLAELVQGRTPPSVKAELEADPGIARELKLRDHDYHLLITLREDYYPHLNTAVERFVAKDLIIDPQRLLPFDGRSALAAVEGPGEGLLEPNVADRIVRKVAAAKQRHLSVSFLGEDDNTPLDMSDLRIEPALLSLLCSRLNSSRLELQKQTGKKELITRELVDTMGERVLENFYHDSLHLLPLRHHAAVAEFIEEKLLSESGQYRQQVVMDSAEKTLADSGMTRAEARDSIHLLIRQRLLRIEDRGDVPRLELTHDVLCPIIGHFRDVRRARDQRLKWWKNAGAIAAVVLFFVAVFLSIFSEMQRRKASQQTRVAQQQTRLAGNERQEAQRQRSLADASRQQARDAEAKAKNVAGGWYAKDMRSKAAEKNLAAAHVLWAHGSEEASLSNPELLGYIAPEPTISSLRKLKLQTATRQFIWTATRRALAGITADNKLWFLNDDFKEPVWLFLSPNGPAIGHLDPTLKTDSRPKVLAAAAWTRDSGEEGILASIENQGLVFIDSKMAVSRPVSVFNTDVTALQPDKLTSGVWVGLKTGIVLRLDQSLKAPDAPHYFLPYVPTPFIADQSCDFPGGRWCYRVSGRWDQTWQLESVQSKQAVKIAETNREKLPERVVVSPNNRYCLITAEQKTRLYRLTLPQGMSSSSLKENGGSSDQGEAPVADRMVVDGLPDGIHPATAFFTQEDQLVIAEDDGTIHFYSIPTNEHMVYRPEILEGAQNGHRALFPVDDGKALVTLVKSEGRTTIWNLLVLRTPPVGQNGKFDLIGKWSFNSRPSFSPVKDSSRVLINTVSDGKASLKLIDTADGTLSESKIPWEEMAPRVIGQPVAALALDAQQEVLCATGSGGSVLLAARSGKQLGDLYLPWPSQRPETLTSLSGENRFTVFENGRTYWEVGWDPYPPGAEPSLYITTASVENKFPGGISAFATHPGGHLSASGYSDGSLLFHQGSGLHQADDHFEELTVLPKRITAVGFSPDGMLLSTADEEGNLLIGNVNRNTVPERDLFGDVSRALPQAAEMGGGRWLLADRSGLQKWSPEDGSFQDLPLPFSYQFVWAVGWDRFSFAVVQETEDLLSWAAVPGGKKIATLDLGESRIIRHSAQPYEKILRLSKVILSPDGRVCCLINHLGEPEFWSIPELAENPPAVVKAQRIEIPALGRIYSATLDGTHQWAWITPKEGPSYLLDLLNPTAPKRLWEGPKVMAAIALPGKTDLLLATENGIGFLHCSSENLSLDGIVEDQADHLIVSRDGKLCIAIHDDGTHILIDLENRKVVGPLAKSAGDDFSAGGFISADHKLIGALSTGKLRWWRPAPQPTTRLAAIATGLTLDLDGNLTSLERHAEQLMGLDISATPPALAHTLSEIHATLLGISASVEKSDLHAKISGDHLEPWAKLALLEKAASLNPGMAKNARQFLLHERLKPKDLRDSTPNTATWSQELVGMMKYRKAMSNLLAESDRLDSKENTALVKLADTFANTTTDVERALESGFLPQSAPEPVSNLLDRLVAYANSLDDDTQKRSAQENLIHYETASRYRNWAARIKQTDANQWNRLGVALNNYEIQLNNVAALQGPESDKQRELAVEVSREECLSYQKSAFESELLGEAYAYVWANWSNAVSSHSSNVAVDERQAYKIAALEMAREATRIDPENEYPWQRLSEVAVDPREEVLAAQKRVHLLKIAGGPKYNTALEKLGSLLRDYLMFDECLDTFDLYLLENPGNVYALVEIGEIMRMGGYPMEESLASFQAARKIDEKNPPADQDLWGLWCMGLTYEQGGRQKEAEACYRMVKRAITADSRNEQEFNSLERLAVILINTGRWAEAEAIGNDLDQRQRWTYLARLAQHGLLMATTEEQKELCKGWLNNVLEQTADESIKSAYWLPRVIALAAIDKPAEALAEVDAYVDGSPQRNKTMKFFSEVHRVRASVLAPQDPSRALWELALSNSQVLLDPKYLWSDARLEKALGENPSYQMLRSLLTSSPWHEPDKFAGLAKFQLEAAKAFRKDHPGEPVKEATESAAELLAHAVMQGWVPDAAAGNVSLFEPVFAMPGWPQMKEEAQQAAIRRLMQEAEAIATAVSKNAGRFSGPRSMATPAVWNELADDIPANRSLKRRKGMDIHGNPYLVDFDKKTATVSPKTIQFYPADQSRSLDFWTATPQE